MRRIAVKCNILIKSRQTVGVLKPSPVGAAGWRGGRLVGWPAGQLAGWVAGLLVGWRVGWLASFKTLTVGTF